MRIEATGAPKWTAYCHCRSCRRHTGAPVSVYVYAGLERAQVRFTKGVAASFASSDGVERGFCARCSSTLTYEGARWPTEIHLHVGVFDDPEPFAPKRHAFVEERISWLHLTDPPPLG